MTDQASLELHELLLTKNITLALAESCTGGTLAASITKHPNCSKYFLGSLVTYSNELKQALLGVSSTVLELHGAVSEETVIEMVTGLLKVTKARLGVAISGIAGPNGGSKLKPVGTVYFAIGTENEPPQTFHKQFQGDRGEIIEQAKRFALNQLYNQARLL